MNNTIKGLPPELEHLALKQSDQKKNDELGQSQFLDLMVAQLKHQDPLNPMESGEFLGQLAQFGTVNGITELQSSFSVLANALQSSQALQASTLVGRSVLVPGNTAALQSGSQVKAAVDIPAGTGALSIIIQDSAGQLVQQLNLGPQGAGLFHFNWDGLDSDGNPVPAGEYRISAQGTVGDEVSSFATLVQAKVESVSLNKAGQGPTLNLGNSGVVSIDEVREVM